MSDFEGYALDQFPLRDEWRTLKALNRLYVYRQKDNNGVYIKDGYAAKLEYPMNEGSIDHAAERFRYLYENFMADAGARVYLSVIPDKNYFLAETNGYPAIDYEAFVEALRERQKRLEALRLELEQAKAKGDYERASRLEYGELPDLTQVRKDARACSP